MGNEGTLLPGGSGDFRGSTIFFFFVKNDRRGLQNSVVSVQKKIQFLFSTGDVKFLITALSVAEYRARDNRVMPVAIKLTSNLTKLRRTITRTLRSARNQW